MAIDNEEQQRREMTKKLVDTNYARELLTIPKMIKTINDIVKQNKELKDEIRTLRNEVARTSNAQETLRQKVYRHHPIGKKYEKNFNKRTRKNN